MEMEFCLDGLIEREEAFGKKSSTELLLSKARKTESCFKEEATQLH